jgi:hypothetical protein
MLPLIAGPLSGLRSDRAAFTFAFIASLVSEN